MKEGQKQINYENIRKGDYIRVDVKENDIPKARLSQMFLKITDKAVEKYEYSQEQRIWGNYVIFVDVDKKKSEISEFEGITLNGEVDWEVDCYKMTKDEITFYESQVALFILSNGKEKE